MKYFSFLILSLFFLASCACNDLIERKIGITSHETKTGYAMVLGEGEDIFARIEELAKNRQIKGATVWAIGNARVEFGYFDARKKAFDKKVMPPMELVSFTGSLAWEGERPVLHAHGVVSDKDFKTYGGHVLGARVGSGSVEITIIDHRTKFIREKNEATGTEDLGM